MAASYPHHLARLFSPTTLRAFSRGSSELIQQTYDVAGYGDKLSAYDTFGEVFEAAYEILCADYRSEYVFKNAIARRLLVEKHELPDAVLFNEFRVGASKADAVILNGTSTVYEVKTDLDNLDRLPAQLESYSQVFDKVYVVTSENRATSVAGEIPEHVGVLYLTSDLAFDVERKASSNLDSIVPERVIEVLRKKEYSDAVIEAFGALPDVPSGILFQECQRLFGHLSPKRAHDLMVNALRSRTPSETKWKSMLALPRALTVAGLTYTMSDAEVASLSALCQGVVARS